MELSGSTIVSINKNYVYCKVEDEMVLLGIEDEIYYGLNSVGAFIWEEIKKPKTIDEIKTAILAEYDVQNSECEQDLYDLLKQLAANGLIDVR
jgi:hypothetical protein